ncbi:MAG: hypothetical protein HC769_08535 [Cyanobacteria bacterium CRU_2_1]|nr:hypothetical protein [Cyanobacteria bacterium RU_5_0]NJR58890.1 hypothetical protein [Cyanobacteria bacterium CRU_2_1]
MKNDAEAIKQFLTWLLQAPPTDSAPSGENSSHLTSPDESGVNLQFSDLDPLDSEVGDGCSSHLPESSSTPFRQVSLEFGEIPAVQDRFHTLLKRRLRAEIERNPPLFPWETRLCDYDSEYSDLSSPDLISTKLWATQLRTLNLPVPMPDKVLTRLFDQCRTVVQSSLREGAKLVQVVESLFPGESQNLNYLAGLVLAAPVRSPSTTPKVNPETSGFPNHYDVATTTQQMLLSLWAAREILETMTLKLFPNQSKVERQWLTDLGLLRLEAEYQPQTHRLRVQGQLPHQGSICLWDDDAHSSAQCSNPGCLSVELFNVKPNKTYSLEIQFEGTDQPPIVFVVYPVTEEES